MKAVLPMSVRLRKLEKQARRLLASLGRLGEEYDSARLSAATGHVARAVSELEQAAAVWTIAEKHERGDF